MSFLDIITLAGSVADGAVGVIQRDSASAFVWISLHIPSDYRHLSGIAPAENEQTQTSSKPSVQMMKPSMRFLFLFQSRLSLKISPFKSEAAAR